MFCLMKAKDVANILGVNVQYIYRHMDEIPHKKIGNKYRFIPEEIERWIYGK